MTRDREQHDTRFFESMESRTLMSTAPGLNFGPRPDVEPPPDPNPPIVQDADDGPPADNGGEIDPEYLDRFVEELNRLIDEGKIELPSRTPDPDTPGLIKITIVDAHGNPIDPNDVVDADRVPVIDLVPKTDPPPTIKITILDENGNPLNGDTPEQDAQPNDEGWHARLRRILDQWDRENKGQVDFDRPVPPSRFGVEIVPDSTPRVPGMSLLPKTDQPSQIKIIIVDEHGNPLNGEDAPADDGAADDDKTQKDPLDWALQDLEELDRLRDWRVEFE